MAKKLKRKASHLNLRMIDGGDETSSSDNINFEEAERNLNRMFITEG
jgi:hypothetical protein